VWDELDRHQHDQMNDFIIINMLTDRTKGTSRDYCEFGIMRLVGVGEFKVFVYLPDGRLFECSKLKDLNVSSVTVAVYAHSSDKNLNESECMEYHEECP
jgi:hypothetical protein